MAETTRAALLATIRTRIHNLVNRGAEICPEYVLPLSTSLSACERCGYTSDVHLLRDVLAQQPEAAGAQAPTRAQVEALLVEADRVLLDAWTDLHEWVRTTRYAREHVPAEHRHHIGHERGIAATEAIRARIGAVSKRITDMLAALGHEPDSGSVNENPLALYAAQEPKTCATWQPIETVPKDGTLVLGALIKHGKVWRVHEMQHNGLAFYTVAGGSLPNMTHWMPLPEPQEPRAGR